MKNKGFTLIELLAVIVILAIIALIATPIILGIINDARTSAKQRSEELVVNAVELAYQTKYGLKGSTPTLDEVMDQLKANGVSKAEVKDTENKIVTNDGVTCTLSNDSNQLKMSCIGNTWEAGKAPTLASMSLVTN